MSAAVVVAAVAPSSLSVLLNDLQLCLCELLLLYARALAVSCTNHVTCQCYESIPSFRAYDGDERARAHVRPICPPSNPLMPLLYDCSEFLPLRLESILCVLCSLRSCSLLSSIREKILCCVVLCCVVSCRVGFQTHLARSSYFLRVCIN